MIARTIYTGTQSSLTFDSKILVFNGSILTFYYYGLDFFNIESFTFDETDMGDAQITADLYLPADFVPNFSRDWYMEFRGEKFYNKTLQPSALKDTNSLKYKYTLTFESQRADLKRYEFANMVAYGGYPQPLSYDFTLPLTASEFISRYNLNLQYYFGASWSIVEGPEFVDTERKTISFSRVTLWNILTQFYDIFGMRWTVSNISGVMTITIGPSVTTLSHIFKYGFEEGLISIERINPLEDIYTRLSGLGSSRNLPYRYFDTSTTEFIGDPDNNIYTQGIPYAGLMPKSYRDYVKGWNSGSPDPLLSLAYNAGVEDVSNGSNFTPWDFCISTGSELKWGIRKGSLEQNEEIYPTLQGVSDASIGRLDEIIAVETIFNDDYEGTSDSSLFESIPSKIMEGMVALGDYKTFEILSDTISLTSDDNKISFAGIFSINGVDDNGLITALDPEGLSSIIDISLSLIGVDSISFGSVAEFEDEFIDTPTGNYQLKLSISINNSSTERKLAFYSELNTIKIFSTANDFKQTFDVWIKNIWGSTKSGGESELEYMHRIWDPLVSGSGEMTVMFSDGLLAGEDYEFKIAKGDDYYITHDETKSYGGVSSHWKLSLIKSEAELETINKYLPYIGFNTSPGDHFFFINIEMPYYPYVYDAEERLENYIQAELALVDDEYPTYAIKPSSIFLESSIVDVNDVKAGNKVTTHDDRILGANDKTFFINAVSVNYEKGKILPTWTITISDKPTSSTNTISIIQGELKELSSSLLSTQNINELAASIDSLYLRKDGAIATSKSPTTFEKPLIVESGINTGDFVQGLTTGSGGALYKDANGMSVLEVDKIRSRKSIETVELIRNQISIYGGKHMFSSASMTVSDVLTGSGYYRCFFDLKGGSVMNQFAMDDMAYCQRFDPENNSIIKYYWRKVVGLGENYIDISDVEGEYDGNDIPGTGDNIVQLGNRTNIDRQAIFVIDQLGGGRCTQYAGVGADPSPFSMADKDFIVFGYDPSTGRAFQTIYGDTYIGARDGSVSYKWDTSTGKMTIKGGLVINPGGVEFPIGVYRGVYSAATTYYKGDKVTYGGSSWVYINDVPEAGHTPEVGVYWGIDAEKGDPGDGGIDAMYCKLSSTDLSIEFDTAGNIPDPSSITLIATVYSLATGVVPYYEFFMNGVSLGASSTTNSKEVSLSGKVYSDMPLGFSVEIRDSWESGDIIATDQLSVIGMKAGENAVQYTIDNGSHGVPASSTGVVSSYAGSGANIQVYEGSTLLTFHTTIDNGRFVVGSPVVSPTGKITVGARSGSGTTTCIIADHSGMDSAIDVVTISYPITARKTDGTDVTFSAVQSITKNKQGDTGSGGADAPYYEYQYAKNGSNIASPLFTATDLNPSGWDVSIPALNPLEYAWKIVAQKAPDGLSLVENWALVGIDKKYHGSSAGPTIHREGDYSSGTSYSGSSTDTDAVWYGGVAYITRVDAGTIPTGTAPTNTTYWNTFGVSADSMATDVFLARQITADEIDFTNATGIDVSLSGTIYVENGGRIGDFIIEDGELYAGAAKRSYNSITIGTNTSSGLIGKIDLRGPSGGTTNNLIYLQGGNMQHQIGEFLAASIRARGNFYLPSGATFESDVALKANKGIRFRSYTINNGGSSWPSSYNIFILNASSSGITTYLPPISDYETGEPILIASISSNNVDVKTNDGSTINTYATSTKWLSFQEYSHCVILAKRTSSDWVILSISNASWW